MGMALNAWALGLAVMAIPAKIPSPKWNGSAFLSAGLIRNHPLSVTSLSSKTSPGTLNATPPQKHVYPNPIKEFAVAETQKFRAELMEILSETKDEFGSDLDIVINICAEIFSEFLQKEYGGPGTLLIEPFTDIFVTLKEKKLPGATLAARTSLLWAQNYVDQDWEIWNSKSSK